MLTEVFGSVLLLLEAYYTVNPLLPHPRWFVVAWRHSDHNAVEYWVLRVFHEPLINTGAAAGRYENPQESSEFL